MEILPFYSPRKMSNVPWFEHMVYLRASLNTCRRENKMVLHVQ